MVVHELAGSLALLNFRVRGCKAKYPGSRIALLTIGMMGLHLKLFLPLNRVDETIRALRLVVGPTLVQSGCIDSCIYQDPSAPNVILYTEEWNSRKNLEQQIRSERFTQILKIMEMCSHSPELNIHSIQESRGIEYIEQIRLSRLSRKND